MAAVISLKMSASWEAEKSSSNAVPRLCNLSLVQIILDRPLEPDSSCTSFYVVVRMQGSARRVLRSPEITLVHTKASGASNGVTPTTTATTTNTTTAALSAGETQATTPGTTGTLSLGSGGCVPIDFNGSIQYSHLLNRNANVLQILLQRRKKYKNKTMNLGYKTLAYCNVDLAQVLQRRIENRFLDLYSDPNCSTRPVGRVEVQSLSTVPLEKELSSDKRKVADEDEEYAMPDVYSEDSDHGDYSDEDPIGEVEYAEPRRQKKLAKAMSVGQKQIKRKLINLLKKLKIGDPNEEDLDVASTSKLWDEFDLIATASDIEEEEEDSDAGVGDSISIRSTPKPVLRPFFATTGGSDETVGADVGTKLLKRLHKQLFPQTETELSPDTSCHVQSGGVGPALKPVNLPLISIRDSKRGSNSPVATGTTLLPDSARGRQHRGSSGLSSGGRLAKGLARMGRRSNFATSQKPPPIESAKSAEIPFGSENVPPEFHNQSPAHRSRPDKAKRFTLQHGTENESSDGDTGQREFPVSHFRSNADPNAYLSDAVPLRPVNDPLLQQVSGTLPTSTSTPTTNRRRTSLDVPGQPRGNRLQSGIQVSNLRPGSMDQLAGVVFLTNPLEPGGKLAADLFASRDIRCTPVSSYTEIKQLFNRLVSEAQSQNLRVSGGRAIRVCILGGDVLVSSVLRAYVDQLSSRSAELAAAFRFFIIPVSVFAPSSSSSAWLHGNSSPRRSLTSSNLMDSRRIHPRSEELANKVSDPTTDLDDKTGPSTAPGNSGLTQTSPNNLSFHLCKVDVTYGALFQDLLLESGDSTAWTPGSTELKARHALLLDRALIYLTNSRNVLSLPIGSCLVASTSRTGRTEPGLPSGTHNHSETNPVPIGDASAGLGKLGPSGLNEEVMVPFLLNVCLGLDPYVNFPIHTHPGHIRSPTGELISGSGPGTTEFPSVLSDPEASSGVITKRHTSPDASGTMSPRAQSTLYSAPPIPVNHWFWELQLEYWIVNAPSTTGLTSNLSTSAAAATNAAVVSSPSNDQTPARRNTMKTVCRGLVVSLGSTQSTPGNRVGDGANSVGDSSSGIAPSRSAGVSSSTATQSQLLTLAVWSKEKKQKIMRLGRRGKDCGCKFEVIDGIRRLLCTGRGSVSAGHSGSSGERHRDAEACGASQPALEAGTLTFECSAKGSSALCPSSTTSSAQATALGSQAMNVFIDGVEWPGLKFFQVTPSWRTHIKCFPVCSLSSGRSIPPPNPSSQSSDPAV